MPKPEQSAGEQGDSKSGPNEHLKEDKAAGEVLQTVPFCKGALVRAGWM